MVYKKNLKINVLEIRGNCPVYHIGDSILLMNGHILRADKTTEICLHSLSSIMPYYVALSHGIAPQILGLNRAEENKAYLQCLDPCHCTGGGTVVFEIEILP